MKRHKWERLDPSGERCRVCLLSRYMHLPIAGPRASWFYVWQDGRTEQKRADHTVPPCQPPKETR
jgi:hypothetical protein